MNKGAFHRYLGVPSGKTIPLNKAMAALKAGSARVKKMAQFAINMKKGDK